MSVLVPSAQINYSQLTAIRASLRDALQKKAGKVIGQSMVIRDITAADISGVAAGNAGFARLKNKNALTAQTWLTNDWGFRQVPANTAVGVYGYVQIASIPLIDYIAFTLGASIPLAQFNLDPLYADQSSSIGYFDPPVVWGPLQSIGINLLAESAVSAGAEQYNLIGYVAEPAGTTVMQDPNSWPGLV